MILENSNLAYPEIKVMSLKFVFLITSKLFQKPRLKGPEQRPFCPPADCAKEKEEGGVRVRKEGGCFSGGIECDPRAETIVLLGALGATRCSA